MSVIVSPLFNRHAIARVSFGRWKAMNLPIGSWVQIDDGLSNIYYCTLWPSDIPEHQILVDDFIKVENKASQKAVQMIPLGPVKTAIRATLQVNLKNCTKDEQLADLGYLYKNGTEDQILKSVRSLINGMLVSPGTVISSQAPGSTLIVKVVSCEEQDTPVIINSATRISIADPPAETSVEALSKTIASLSLSSDAPTSHGKKPTGLEKAYEALYEVLSYPFLYRDWIATLGIECPKGILLYGPPGVGKTFLVTSVAEACGAKVFVIQGPEIYGPYLGESEEKLRLKFKEAQGWAAENDSPVILFIDEIDALTPHRDRAQSHENRVVAQLLTLMDGIASRGRLVIIGATNRPNSIDPALRRPGRFDREISIDAPDKGTRHALITSQLRSMPLDNSMDVESLATMTNGYVAADITSLCREAAMHAVQRATKDPTKEMHVGMEDFMVAFGSVGPSMQRGFQVQVEQTGWDDIGGLEDVKKKLKQAVEWPILYKDSFIRLGLKPPRGILLYGPPGCSKTTLVKVIASTSGAAFLSINGAQLYSPYVGDSEKIIRTTFQKARASAPSIIFLDETEAIVGKRDMGNGGGGGDSVQERVLSTLLNEMDGVETAESVLVVGATNRPDMLDAALLRPGRFDRLVYVPPPDFKARWEILKIHTRRIPLSDDVNLEVVADGTDNYTGADLQNVCREAAMISLRENHWAVKVTMEHFLQALATIPASNPDEKNYQMASDLNE
ncbi:P-loop containing nucleoside triphosphate hydrolase protein [Phycomyces nitens]|nr:P-loop containing nucleoside triphosphate hydrolase protein [Phycomyces nitens]